MHAFDFILVLFSSSSAPFFSFPSFRLFQPAVRDAVASTDLRRTLKRLRGLASFSI
jgi:hypothetical protein